MDRDADSIELLRAPAYAEADRKAPTGKHVYGREPSRQHGGVVEGDIEDTGSQPGPLRHRSDDTQRVERIELELVLLRDRDAGHAAVAGLRVYGYEQALGRPN